MSEPWRPSRELQAVIDAREVERNRNYAAEFYRGSGASETDAIDWRGFATWLREQHTEVADLMAASIESDLRHRPAVSFVTPDEPGRAEERAYLNTDRELFREVPEGEPMSYYSPSIHVTIDGAIGMCLGGRVIQARIEDWHDAYSAHHGIEWHPEPTS